MSGPLQPRMPVSWAIVNGAAMVRYGTAVRLTCPENTKPRIRPTEQTTDVIGGRRSCEDDGTLSVSSKQSCCTWLSLLNSAWPAQLCPGSFCSETSRGSNCDLHFPGSALQGIPLRSDVPFDQVSVIESG